MKGRKTQLHEDATRGRCVSALRWSPWILVDSVKGLIGSPLLYLIADPLFSVWANLWTNCGCQTVGQIHVPITRTVASTAVITATAPATVTWQHTADQVNAIHVCVTGHIIVIQIRSMYALLMLCIASSSSWLHRQLWEPCRKHTTQFWDGHLQWREPLHQAQWN